MSRDSDPRSLLAQAMRACDERGLRELANAITAEFDARDQQRLDDALASKTLVAWKDRRGFRTRMYHLVTKCGLGPTAGGHYGQARQVRTVCLQLVDYATVWPIGPYQFDRDGNDENDERYAKYKVEITCKKCLTKLAK